MKNADDPSGNNEKAKDPASIPPGEYCYRVYPIREGEKLSTNAEEFGKSLREYSYKAGLYKQVLCPYWQRTDYGTLKCLYMNKEVLDQSRNTKQAFDLLATKIGKEAASNFPISLALSDEIKVCGVNEDKEDPWGYDEQQ